MYIMYLCIGNLMTMLQRASLIHEDASCAHAASYAHTGAEELTITPTEFRETSDHLTNTSCNEVSTQ